jgi:site-specific recombinase XerD
MDTEILVKETKHLCDEFELKIPTSSIRKSIAFLLKTFDYEKLTRGEYSYENLLHVCANNIVRYPILASILMKNEKNGEDASLFVKNARMNISKIQEIKEIVKNEELPYINPSSSECLNLLYDTIRDENMLKQIRATELMQKLHDIFKNKESYVKLKQLVDYTAFFLQKANENEKARNLHDMYDSFIDANQQTADVAFARESKWKQSLVEFLREKNTDRLSRTSAYPELALRKNMAFAVMLFRHLESYIAHVHKNAPRAIDKLHWFFNTVEIKELENALVFIANNYVTADNDRVKSKHTKHHCYDFLKMAIVTLRDRIPHYFEKCGESLATLNVSNLINRVNDQREIPVESIRRHFYDDEITRIMENVANGRDGLKYTLIFTILREVGLRISAVCSLRVKHFLNAKGEYLNTGKKLEKGRKMRTFPISENLREKLDAYLNENEHLRRDMNAFLFFSNTKTGYISTDTVRDKLVRITESLGIHGHHVHPHAFRHTIVNDLMARGNKLENVSKFIGHTSIATTEQYYWTTELENIIPTMTIPWLKKENENGKQKETTENETENECCGMDRQTLIGVITTYHSVLTNEQKITIKKRIPNIEEIFAEICSESVILV